MNFDYKRAGNRNIRDQYVSPPRYVFKDANQENDSQNQENNKINYRQKNQEYNPDDIINQIMMLEQEINNQKQVFGQLQKEDKIDISKNFEKEEPKKISPKLSREPNQNLSRDYLSRDYNQIRRSRQNSVNGTPNSSQILEKNDVVSKQIDQEKKNQIIQMNPSDILQQNLIQIDILNNEFSIRNSIRSERTSNRMNDSRHFIVENASRQNDLLDKYTRKENQVIQEIQHDNQKVKNQLDIQQKWEKFQTEQKLQEIVQNQKLNESKEQKLQEIVQNQKLNESQEQKLLEIVQNQKLNESRDSQKQKENRKNYKQQNESLQLNDNIRKQNESLQLKENQQNEQKHIQHENIQEKYFENKEKENLMLKEQLEYLKKKLIEQQMMDSQQLELQLQEKKQLEQELEKQKQSEKQQLQQMQQQFEQHYEKQFNNNLSSKMEKESPNIKKTHNSPEFNQTLKQEEFIQNLIKEKEAVLKYKDQLIEGLIKKQHELQMENDKFQQKQQYLQNINDSDGSIKIIDDQLKLGNHGKFDLNKFERDQEIESLLSQIQTSKSLFEHCQKELENEKNLRLKFERQSIEQSLKIQNLESTKNELIQKSEYLHLQLEEINKNNLSIVSEQTQKDEQINNQNSEIDTLNQSLQLKDKIYNQNQKKIKILELKIQALTQQLDGVNTHHSASIDKLNIQIKQMEDKLTQKEKDIDILKQNIQDQNDIHKNDLNQIQELKQIIDVNKLEYDRICQKLDQENKMLQIQNIQHDSNFQEQNIQIRQLNESLSNKIIELQMIQSLHYEEKNNFNRDIETTTHQLKEVLEELHQIKITQINQENTNSDQKIIEDLQKNLNEQKETNKKMQSNYLQLEQKLFESIQTIENFNEKMDKSIQDIKL